MFLNKFYLFNGLKAFYEDDQMAQSIEATESNAMNTFNCSENDWPICLYDFTYKNRIPTYFCYKV